MKNLQVLLTTYNRPAILNRCTKSMIRALQIHGMNFHVYDDCSTDPATHELLYQFRNFSLNTVNLNFNKKRLGCDENIFQAGNQIFQDHPEADRLLILDSDMVFNYNYFISLYTFMSYIESDGANWGAFSLYNSKMHPQVGMFGNGLILKNSVGGMGVLVKRTVFKAIQNPASWDWKMCDVCHSTGHLIITTQDSYCEHISTEEDVDRSHEGSFHDKAINFLGE